jgi:hypothetical protein
MNAADPAAHPAATASAGPGPVTVPPFAVIPGAQVAHALQGRERQITQSGQLHVIDDFFHELRRYG